MFFGKQKNGKWTWKSPNGETRNQKYFILFAHIGIVQNLKIIRKVRCSDHRTVRSRISLHLKSERKKLIKKGAVNKLAATGKLEQFRISLQKRYSALTGDGELIVQGMNDNFRDIITECAVEVRRSIVRQDAGKLSKET